MRRIALFLLCAASCAADLPADPDCRRSDDCDAALCVSGHCRTVRSVGLTSGNEDEDVDPLGPMDSAVPVRTSGPCSATLLAAPQALVINEVLANVPTGPDGDANGDGVRDAYDDEFVELANLSDRPVDLTGIRITVNGKLKFTFEPLCLSGHDAVVVFGGGSVGSSVDGNAVVSESRFALPNSGGTVALIHDGDIVDSVTYPDGRPASITRAPQLMGADWVSHLELSARPFSPGDCPDGTPLRLGCAQPTDDSDVGVGD